jgi:hypothetical protein
MHKTAMAGESTWLSWVRKNAGPKNPIDCMICQTWKYMTQWKENSSVCVRKEISPGHWMKFHHPECIVITNFFHHTVSVWWFHVEHKIQNLSKIWCPILRSWRQGSTLPSEQLSQILLYWQVCLQSNHQHLQKLPSWTREEHRQGPIPWGWISEPIFKASF